MAILTISVEPLRLPFAQAFEHATAKRACGQSVLVSATLGEHTGFGEGCPREYVTGEDLQSTLKAANTIKPCVAEVCEDLASLKTFVQRERTWIDSHPSAWCAIEGALLDLFARQKNTSVDALLGLGAPQGHCQYSAVLGSEPLDNARALIAIYAHMQMRDYKIKIAQDAEAVHQKIALISKLHQDHGLPAPRIRLDANNYWRHNEDNALRVLETFTDQLVAVEEPLGPDNVEGLSRLSTQLNLPIILDESASTMAKIEPFLSAPGQWIINFKISKMGGLLRTIEGIQTLRSATPPVRFLLGAHVGETSILTRAAQIASRCVTDGPWAHEGAFGQKLLKQDITSPSIEFGVKGLIDLNAYDGPGWGIDYRNEVLV